MGDDFFEDDDSFEVGRKAEQNAIREVMSSYLEIMVADQEIARAKLARGDKVGQAIIDAILLGDTDAFEQLAPKLAQALSDQEITGLAVSCLLAIPSEQAIWLVRDLFEIEPFPFLSTKKAKSEMIAEAREWVKRCSTTQLKAYAMVVVKALPRADKESFKVWVAGL